MPPLPPDPRWPQCSPFYEGCSADAQSPPQSSGGTQQEQPRRMSTQGRRYYTPADLALLWSRSGGLCGFPECPVICVEPANNNDLSATVGRDCPHRGGIATAARELIQICLSKNGTCTQISFSFAQLTMLSLMPKTNTYTVEMLRTWKTAQEARHRRPFWLKPCRT